MSQSMNGKVVAMGDHLRAKARLSRQQSEQMIADCRALAAQRMSRALAAILDRVEDDLFELAEKAPDREAQNAYLDARSQARDKRTAIQDAFQRELMDLFDRHVSGREAPASVKADPEELCLVNEDEDRTRIAMGEMSRKLHASCEGELGALSQRLGFLLDRPELADDANPLGPVAVCAALKQACDQLEASLAVRMTLLQQLERHVEEDLRGLYHDINAHLVARSVLPQLRPRIRRAASGKARAPDAASAGPRNRDAFAALSGMLATSMPAAPTVPVSFVNELTRMHREPAVATQASQHALENLVRKLRDSPAGAALAPSDSATIDLVAMLFDFIFDDAHIPAAAKAHLGRLQIPTVKVALLDRSFFSSKAHPARRLLDLLAEASLGLDNAGARDGEVLALVERTVQRVLDDFVTDQQVFAKLATEVASFIEERRRVEASLVERSARVIEERERDEDARLAAHDAMSRRLAAREWTPPVVRTMLEGAWTRALARVHRTEGEDSAMWQGLLATAEELLWSVEPKHLPEDRKRLVTMLPGMLRRIQLGMERGEMAEADRDAFLGMLVDCHAAAMKAGTRGLAPVPPAPAPAPRRAEPAIERSTIPVGDIQVEEIRLNATRERTGRNVHTRTGIWTHLQRGTWVEFCADDGSRIRARLTWISPNKGVYLFTNPFSAVPAVSVSPDALAEQMRRTQARVIDDAPLTERAVDSMLATLRRA